MLNLNVNIGKIKVYRDLRNFQEKSVDENNLPIFRSNTTIILKISGIWETSTEIGLTYKFVEMQDKKIKNEEFFEA